MATAVLAPQFIVKSWTNNGIPNASGTIATYAAGTTTPIATYTDITAVTANPNPVTLNFRGEAAIYVLPNVGYKFVESDASGNLIKTTDNVIQSQLLSLYGGTDTGIANAYVLNFSASFTSYTVGTVIYWLPANSNTGASTINVNGLGVVPIVNPNGSQLGANQITAGQITQIAYINGQFQLVSTGNFVGANVGTFGMETPLAAAATVDLGSAAAHNVQITGSASITSFGTSAQLVAPIFVVRMSGASTLTASSSLILPGGTNIVTANGDAFVAEYMGAGSWRVLIYQYVAGVANSRVKSADTQLISTTTLTADPDLFTNTLAVGKYAYEIFLLFDSVAAGAGFKWQDGGTALDSRSLSPSLVVGQVNAASVGPNLSTIYGVTVAYATVSTAANSNSVLYKGSLLVGTAGTFGISWAQNTSTASATTLRAGSYLNVALLGTGSGSGTTTRVYTAAGSGTETIPAGYSFLTAECWGGTGGGGGGFVVGMQMAGGGGGGSGAYVYTRISVAGLGGQTINYTVGAAGAAAGNGTASTITSGTFVIATMTGGPGLAGANAAGVAAPGVGGAGGNASGGVNMNTAGNTGAAGLGNNAGGTGGAGGAGVAGINYGGNSGGNGSNTTSPGQVGKVGVVVFSYA